VNNKIQINTVDSRSSRPRRNSRQDAQLSVVSGTWHWRSSKYLHLDKCTILIYLHLLSTVTLKRGWGVIQGHWKWHIRYGRSHSTSY